MENSFELGGRQFKLNKIDPFKQFHVARRMGPILVDLLPALRDAGGMTSVQKLAEIPETEKLNLVGKILSPIISGMSKLSDEDADRVLLDLLSAVEMQQPTGNWARVASDSLLMIQDFELADLLNIAGRSFVFNLSRFTSALPQQ